MTADNPQIPGPQPAVEGAEDLLAAYRESQALPDTVKARVRQRLLVAGAPAPEPAPPAQLDQARRRRSAVDQRWWIAAAAIVLLVSAALALLSGKEEGILASRSGVDGAAYTADSRATRGDAMTREGGVGRDTPARPSAEVSPQTDGTTPRAAANAGALSTATTTTTTTTRAPTPPAPTRPMAEVHEQRPGPSAAPDPAPPPTPSLALTAEKALLEGAWRALAAGEHQDAREALRRHRRDFADGILSQEREVLGVLLACKIAAPGAWQQAARFRREHPESPWRARLDDVCPATSSPE